MNINRRTADEQRSPSIGLEHLTLRAEPLPVFISAAAAGGAETICLSVEHPRLHDWAGLRETRTQLDASNISVAMGDGFLLQPQVGLDRLERNLDLLAEIGAPLANTCAYEPDPDIERDPGYIEDLLGEFCRIARTAGIGVLLEFTPLSHVPSLASAADLVQRLGQPNLQILIDTLHLARAGEGPDDLRKVDQRLIGYCQLSDGPLVSESLSAYLDEALYDREIPGQGQLPLEEELSLLPRDITISAEVPLRRLAQAGISPEERARRILDGSRSLLARAWAALPTGPQPPPS